jgi:hypothetical protein
MLEIGFENPERASSFPEKMSLTNTRQDENVYQKAIKR